MGGWGPALVNVSIRRLDRTHLAEVGLTDPTLLRCVVLAGFEYPRDPKGGCFDEATVPGKPGWCRQRTGSYLCVLGVFGAYYCPPRHDVDRSLPLRQTNGSTDARGRMRLDAPLVRTHPTPALPWDRYPHADGWIDPWTSGGRLRPGVSFDFTERGSCSTSFGSELTVSGSALRCLWNGVYEVDPCFVPDRHAPRPGMVVACSERPGETTFVRFLVTKTI